MDNYTFENIRDFISQMRKETPSAESKKNVVFIPFVGRKIYQRYLFREKLVNAFETCLKEAENGTAEEQAKFLSEMAPVLKTAKKKGKWNPQSK